MDDLNLNGTSVASSQVGFRGKKRSVELAVACSLLDRQDKQLAQDFEREGGFTERLHRVRSVKGKNLL